MQRKVKIKMKIKYKFSWSDNIIGSFVKEIGNYYSFNGIDDYTITGIGCFFNKSKSDHGFKADFS